MIKRDLLPDGPVAHPTTTVCTVNAPSEEHIREDQSEDVYNSDVEEDDNTPSKPDDGIFGDIVGPNFDCWQEEALQKELYLEEAERLQRKCEQEDEGDRRKKRMYLAITGARLLVCQLDDAIGYPSAHPYVMEAPGLETLNYNALVEWAQRSEALDNSRGVVDTWSARRRGNMFK